MNLNEEQLEAVSSTHAHTLVLAGAGTGKTRVIIRRIETLVAAEVNPSKIVAATFTNKASMELRHRLITNIGPQARDIICGTFHRISAQFLKNHCDKIGLASSFQLLTEDDQKKILKKILKDLAQETRMQNLLERISQTKERVSNTATNFLQDLRFKKIFDEYQKELTEGNYLDYSDLMMLSIKLFETQPELINNLVEHVLVDEYQDINDAQYKWIQLISRGKTLFCVGDEDQAIYSFRGANVEYIQRFQQDYPEAKIVKLEKNYRSAAKILTGATNLISKNPRIYKKQLIPTTDKTGQINITRAYNEYDEAQLVANIVTKWLAHGYKIGILVRTNLQIYPIEQSLVLAKIGYNVTSNRRFYDRKEIQDLIAYLKILVHPRDAMAFARMINTPKRHIGPAKQQILLDAMKELDTDAINSIKAVLPKMPKNAAEKCKILMMQMQNWYAMLTTAKPEAILEKILADIDYIKQEDCQASHREHIRHLKDHLSKADSLKDFLDDVQFSGIEVESEYKVHLMTMHAAKGLEFDIIVSPGWEENVFPSGLAKSKKELEEERRLAYVVITRARECVEITHARMRRINGQVLTLIPSRFLFDL